MKRVFCPFILWNDDINQVWYELVGLPLFAQLSHDLDLSKEFDQAIVIFGKVIDVFYGHNF